MLPAVFFSTGASQWNKSLEHNSLDGGRTGFLKVGSRPRPKRLRGWREGERASERRLSHAEREYNGLNGSSGLIGGR